MKRFIFSVAVSIGIWTVASADAISKTDDVTDHEMCSMVGSFAYFVMVSRNLYLEGNVKGAKRFLESNAYFIGKFRNKLDERDTEIFDSMISSILIFVGVVNDMEPKDVAETAYEGCIRYLGDVRI